MHTQVMSRRTFNFLKNTLKNWKRLGWTEILFANNDKSNKHRIDVKCDDQLGSTTCGAFEKRYMSRSNSTLQVDFFWMVFNLYDQTKWQFASLVTDYCDVIVREDGNVWTWSFKKLDTSTRFICSFKNKIPKKSMKCLKLSKLFKKHSHTTLLRM